MSTEQTQPDVVATETEVDSQDAPRSGRELMDSATSRAKFLDGLKRPLEEYSDKFPEIKAARDQEAADKAAKDAVETAAAAPNAITAELEALRKELAEVKAMKAVDSLAADESKVADAPAEPPKELNVWEARVQSEFGDIDEDSMTVMSELIKYDYELRQNLAHYDAGTDPDSVKNAEWIKSQITANDKELRNERRVINLAKENQTLRDEMKSFKDGESEVFTAEPLLDKVMAYIPAELGGQLPNLIHGMKDESTTSMIRSRLSAIKADDDQSFYAQAEQLLKDANSFMPPPPVVTKTSAPINPTSGRPQSRAALSNDTGPKSPMSSRESRRRFLERFNSGA